MIPVIPHILEQDTGGATAKDDPVENGVDDKTKSDPVDGYIKHSDKKGRARRIRHCHWLTIL